MSEISTVRREVFSLAWPALLHSLLHTLVFIVDRAMLGHYSTVAISSMQVSGPLVWSSTMIFGSFLVGTIALVARSWGEGDRVRAERTAAVSLAVAGALGVLVGALLAAGAGLVVSAFGLDPDSARAAETYLRTVALFFPFLFVSYTGVAVLRAAGDTRTPLRLALVANVLNLLGNYALIFGNFGLPECGILGAALASGGAHCIEAILIIGLLLRGRCRIRLGADAFLSWPPILRSLLRISLPSLLERICFHAGFLVFAGMITRLGEVASAANQACIALESFSFIPAGAFGIAAATVMGQKLGAGREGEARAGGRSAVWMSVGFLTCMGILYVSIPGFLVAFFTSDPEVVPIAVGCLAIAALAQPTMAVGITLAEGLKGAGDTRSPFFVTVVGIWGVRLGLCWLLAFRMGMGLRGIWYATAIDWAVRALLLVAVYRRGRWLRVTV